MLKSSEAASLYVYRPARPETSALPEFGVVTTRVEATTFDGTPVPVGSLGTIVSVWDGGIAYDVEFVEPLGIASFGSDDLDPA